MLWLFWLFLGVIAYAVITYVTKPVSDADEVEYDTSFSYSNPPYAPIVTGNKWSRTDFTPTWNWTSGGNDGVGSYRFRLNGGLFVTTTDLTYTPDSDLPVGRHTLEVQEANISGEWSDTGSYVSCIVEEKLINASDAADTDQFGISVSISGDGNTLVVGAHYADGAGTNQGQAYVYTRSGGNWTQQQILTASNGQDNHNFGSSVSISTDGTTILVGAADDYVIAIHSAYVYVLSDGVWVEQQILTASIADSDDQFGRFVSLSGDGNTALVSAHLSDVAGSDYGAAYIFTRSEGTWTEQQILYPSTSASEFGFTLHLSSDGNNAIIGTYSSNTVYIFAKIGGSWIEQALFSHADSRAGYPSGIAISNNGTAVVGADGHDKVYIYSRDGGAWAEYTVLQPSGDNSFGRSVSLSSDGVTLLVGANDDSTQGSTSGSASYYTFSEGTWSLTEKFYASDATAGDEFGESVSLSSDGCVAVVGAWRAHYGALSNTGAAYIF